MTGAIDGSAAAFEMQTAADSGSVRGMKMEELQRERYRRLRNLWGLTIAIAWIAGWWVALSAFGPATRSCAALTDCAGTATASGGSAIGFVFEMFFVILASPIAFAISPRIARAIVEREGRRAARARHVTDAALAARQQAERKAQEKAAEKQAREAHLARRRDEFLTRLGTAVDALNRIPAADDKGRAQIMLAVSGEMRSLVAAYDKDETVEALRDEAVMLALASTLKSLKEQGPLQPEAQRLLEAVKHAAVAQGKRRK